MKKLGLADLFNQLYGFPPDLRGAFLRPPTAFLHFIRVSGHALATNPEQMTHAIALTHTGHLGRGRASVSDRSSFGVGQLLTQDTRS